MLYRHARSRVEVAGQRGGGVEVVGRDGSPGRQAQRHDARPVRQRDVLRVVDGRAGAHLRGDLDEIEGEHSGRGEFAFIRGPAIGGAPRPDVIQQAAQGPRFLRGVVDHARVTADDDRAEVHRMVHGRPGQHQGVDEGRGDADGQARPRCFGCPGGQHRAAAGGTVQVEGFAVAGVRRRQHHRPTGTEVAQVTDQGLVQDVVDRLAVVAGAFPVAGGRRSRGGAVCGHQRIAFDNCTST